LEAIRQRRPDVMLADILMPDRDGYSMIRHLRAREREFGAGRVPQYGMGAGDRRSPIFAQVGLVDGGIDRDLRPFASTTSRPV
jgi:CheY-like chemotaxis protein